MILGRGATSSFVCFPKRCMRGCAPGILPGDGMENIRCGAGEFGISGGFFLSRKNLRSAIMQRHPGQRKQNRVTVCRRVRLILGWSYWAAFADAGSSCPPWVTGVSWGCLLMGFLQIKDGQDHQWELEMPGSKTQVRTEGSTHMQPLRPPM